MDDFQEALEGKTSTEGWTAEKLSDYHKFVTDKVKEEESKVGGLREAKRAETERVEKLKKEAEDILKAKEEAEKNNPPADEKDKPQQSPEMIQFRSEQVEKARQKLFSSVKLSDEDKIAFEDRFKQLDSGKLDSDLIYKDMLAAVVATNPDKFIGLAQEREKSEAEAARIAAEQAAGTDAAPGGEGEKKFSDEALKLAKEAGITPEAATRQLQNGMTRTLE